jgi:xanthine dehydrogenase YagR molybdenum-binding subunit
MLVGYGMATATYPSHRSAAAANARIAADGSAQVFSGTQDLGTGSYTVFAQVAADALGLPVERVRFELGDTNFPNAPVSGGSQTAASVGTAVHAAASAVRAKLLDLAVQDQASPLYGKNPNAIVAKDGRFSLATAPQTGERFVDILERHDLQHIEGYAESKPGDETKQYSMHAFGAQFAEVRVDPDLGTVRVERLIGAFASGRILNAKTARSQYVGGMTWGLSMALLEDTRTDLRSGRIMSANLEKYLVPVNADIPYLEAYLVEEDDTHVNPIGVKGIGEIGIVGSGAAIANAVFNATGIRVRDLPISPEKLLQA